MNAPPETSRRMLTAPPEPEQLARELAYREGAAARRRGAARAANPYRRPIERRTTDSDRRAAAWELGYDTEDRRLAALNLTNR